MSQEDVLDLLSLVDLAVVLPLVIDAKYRHFNVER